MDMSGFPGTWRFPIVNLHPGPNPFDDYPVAGFELMTRGVYPGQGAQQGTGGYNAANNPPPVNPVPFPHLNFKPAGNLNLVFEPLEYGFPGPLQYHYPGNPNGANGPLNNGPLLPYNGLLYNGPLNNEPPRTHANPPQSFTPGPVNAPATLPIRPANPRSEPAPKRVKVNPPEPVVIDLVSDESDHEAERNGSRATPARDRQGDLSVFLGQLLEVFPDICEDFAEKMFDKYDRRLESGLSPEDALQSIIGEILEKDSYPQRDNKKRKRQSENEPDKIMSELEEFRRSRRYFPLAVRILYREFPQMRQTSLQAILGWNKTLQAAYLFLLETDPERRREIRHARRTDDIIIPAALNEINLLEHELRLARDILAEKSRLRTLEETEKQNEELHRQLGTLIECQCCFADVPVNRTVTCSANEMHPFCYACVKRAAETQIGMMKHEIICFHVDGCPAGFDRESLKLAIGEQLLRRLDHLKQMDEVAKAGLEGLTECPFCDFKAICPPVEEDKEFRCHNPDCEKVSCRLCKAETHVPKTCEEARKDRGLSHRRAVEEAMTEALIRTCPRCKVRVVKMDGCNKVTCVKCHAIMCDVCKADITSVGYRHFRGNNSGSQGCPLHEEDFGKRRQQEEVKRARNAAVQSLMVNNSDLKAEDLHLEDLDGPKPPHDGAKHAHHYRHGQQQFPRHGGHYAVPEQGQRQPQPQQPAPAPGGGNHHRYRDYGNAPPPPLAPLPVFQRGVDYDDDLQVGLPYWLF